LARALQVAAEGLFDDDALESRLLRRAVSLAHLAEAGDDRREGVRGRGEIEQPVPRGPVFRIHLAQTRRELLVRLVRAVIVAADVINRRLELLPDVLIERF